MFIKKTVTLVLIFIVLPILCMQDESKALTELVDIIHTYKESPELKMPSEMRREHDCALVDWSDKYSDSISRIYYPNILPMSESLNQVHPSTEQLADESLELKLQQSFIQTQVSSQQLQDVRIIDDYYNSLNTLSGFECSAEQLNLSRYHQELLQKRIDLIKREILEPIVNYNTSTDILHARQLLASINRNTLLVPSHKLDRELHDILDSVKKVVCQYPSGAFKDTLTKQESESIARLYSRFLQYTTHSHENYQQELLALSKKNGAFTTTLAQIKEAQHNSLSNDILERCSGICARISGGCSLTDISYAAQFNIANRIGDRIATYIKAGHYQKALDEGIRSGYFVHYPQTAQLVKAYVQSKVDASRAERNICKNLRTIAEQKLAQQIHQLRYLNETYGKSTIDNKQYMEILSERMHALDSLINGNARYTEKTYQITQVNRILSERGMNIDVHSIQKCYGHQMQQQLYKEAVDLLKQVTRFSTEQSNQADKVTFFALKAREYVQKGDIIQAIRCTDKAWGYCYPDIAKKVSTLINPISLRLASELSQKMRIKSDFEKPVQFELQPKEIALFPEGKQALLERGVDLDKFMQPIHENIQKRGECYAILQKINIIARAKSEIKEDSSAHAIYDEIIDAHVALHELSNSQDSIADLIQSPGRVLKAAREQVLHNLSNPYRFLKESFVDPLVTIGGGAGRFLIKHQNLLTMTPPPTGKDFKALKEDIQYGLQKVGEGIENWSLLPEAERDAIRGKILGDLMTGRILGGLISASQVVVGSIKTAEEVKVLIDGAAANNTIQLAFDEVNKIAYLAENTALPELVKTTTAAKDVIDLPRVMRVQRGLQAAIEQGTITHLGQYGKYQTMVPQGIRFVQLPGATLKALQKGEGLSKTNSNPSVETGINQGIETLYKRPDGQEVIRLINIKPDSIGVIKKFEVTKNSFDHIFSKSHIGEGIMKLGVSQSEILDRFIDIVHKANEYNLLKENSNQIETIINGHQATIRVQIHCGEVVRINGFEGYSERKIGNTFSLISE